MILPLGPAWAGTVVRQLGCGHSGGWRASLQGSCFLLTWRPGPRVSVQVTRPPRPWGHRTGHIPLVKAVTGGWSVEGDRRADNMAPPAQEVPRVSEVSGSAQGQAQLHTQEARGGGRVHRWTWGPRWTPTRGSAACPWGPPHTGPPPSLALLHGGFARAGVCNQKVQRPFHCA